MNLSESFSLGFDFTLDFDLITAGETATLDDPVVGGALLGGLTGVDSPTTFSAPAPSTLEAEPTSSPEPVLESEAAPLPTLQISTQFSSFGFDGEPTFSFQQFTDETVSISTGSGPVESFDPVITTPETTVLAEPIPIPDTSPEPPSTYTFTPIFSLLSLNYNFDLDDLDFALIEAATTFTSTTTTTSQSAPEEETVSEPPITVQLADLEFDAQPETSTDPPLQTTAAESLSFSSQSGAAISPQQTTSQPEPLLTECTTDCPAPGDKVPEPGLLLLLGLGIFGIATTGRRRMSRSTTLTPSLI